jgi:Flp pilus assembly protein TadD
MHHGGSVPVIAWACLALTSLESLRAQEYPMWVELSCRISRGFQTSAGKPLLVEISHPADGPICQRFAHAGESVRFKLKPGIFVACVMDRSGGRRCQSVDVYPPPATRVASFSVELLPPSPASQTGRFCMADKTDLVVPREARREFGEGMKDWRCGNAAEAVRHLERALKIHHNYPEALTNLGSACHVAGDNTRAAQLFEQVTQIAPEMYAGWLNLGVMLLLTGQPRQALQAEMQALRLRPDDPFVLYQVGLCQYRLGEFDAARRSLERVIELDPSSAIYPHLSLARIALAENRKDEVARLLREISRLHPNAPQPPGMRELVSQLAGVRQQ